MTTRVQRGGAFLRMPLQQLLLAVTLTCACLLLLLPTRVNGDYSAKDDVVVLTEKNFEKEVLQSADYWLVEFYAPWCVFGMDKGALLAVYHIEVTDLIAVGCGHCQKLEPEFKAAAKKLKKHARLGAVDATAHQTLAQKYQIQGYPTLKEFGAKKNKPSDYRGGRTKSEIVQYVKNSEEAKALGVRSASVTTLEFANVHTFLTQNEKLPSAIFFGSATAANGKKGKKKATGKPPSWLSSVAENFTKGKKKKKPTVQIAFVSGTEAKIAKHFGIDDAKLPAVVFVNPAGTKFAVADVKSLNEDSAKDFIAKSLALDDTAVEQQMASVPLFPAPEVAKKKPKAQLNRLDESSVRECLKKSGKMCVVVAKQDDEMLKALAKNYRRDPFRFLTSDKDATIFQTLTSFPGAKGSEVIVLKPGKKVKYSALSGVNDEKAIAAFLDKILAGAVTFSPIAIQDAKVDLDLSGKAAAEAETAKAQQDDHLHEEL